MEQNEKKPTVSERVNTATTKLAIIATPVIFATVAHAEESTIDIGTLGITGLAVAAASIFTIKASPSLMMWGYRKILGFIGR